MKKTEEEKTPPIIIKRVKKGGGAGHHGGAWKVAYADFVTAMMAFFLLLWLLNVTTEEQKFAISNYFDPTFPKVSNVESGSGGVMGGTTLAKEGAMSETVQPITQPEVPDTSKRKGGNDETTPQMKDTSVEDAEEIAKKAEEEAFQEVENQIRQSLEANPELKALTNNLIMDITPEGLRIQIVDQDKTAMFPSGSAQMFEKTQKLIALVSKAVATLPNQLSVRGHTDSAPYAEGAGYTNWELSADRANASRRALLAGGLSPARVSNVTGKADTDHLDKANPMAPINRRISIILLRKDPPKPTVTKTTTGIAVQPAKPAQGNRSVEVPNAPYNPGAGIISTP